MKAYLLIDFGSTYTKLTAVNAETEEILGTAKDITTVDTNIMIGFNNAYEKLLQQIGRCDLEIIDKMACSSAAGGLKMVAIGLVPELTAEAAKRTALGAGARVLHVYTYELTSREIEEMRQAKLDVILLCGGTDGGNKDTIIHNARLLANAKLGVPIVVAGNKAAADEIENIFKSAQVCYRITDNVMPRLNVLHTEPAREEIRKLFIENIAKAKGLNYVEELTGAIAMPTPAAVLQAAAILSRGTKNQDGLGDLLVVDVGGATTDIHSIALGLPSKPGVVLKGLEEPLVKRTVEGDLGMRYSSMALCESVGHKKLKAYLRNPDVDVISKCKYRMNHIDMVPETEEDIEFDEAMAKCAVEVASQRHAGVIESVYTPMGVVFFQLGKDLLNVKYVVGTGGVLINSRNPKEILEHSRYNERNANILLPMAPNFLIDKSYILSAMGLLSQKYPDTALRMMKKYLLQL